MEVVKSFGVVQTHYPRPITELVHVDVQVSEHDQQHHSHHNHSYDSQQPKTLAAGEFLNEFSSSSSQGEEFDIVLWIHKSERGGAPGFVLPESLLPLRLEMKPDLSR